MEDLKILKLNSAQAEFLQLIWADLSGKWLDKNYILPDTLYEELEK